MAVKGVLCLSPLREKKELANNLWKTDTRSHAYVLKKKEHVGSTHMVGSYTRQFLKKEGEAFESLALRNFFFNVRTGFSW